MKRIVMALTLVALTPFLMGGGMAPPTSPQSPKITGPAISGVLVVDTHMEEQTFVNSAGATPGPKAKYAALRLEKGSAAAGALVRLPTLFAAFQGCDAALTDLRFAWAQAHPNRLKDYVSGAAVDALLAGLGLDPATVGDPIITDIDQEVCTADPENPAPGSAPGILSFRMVIQFIQP